MADLIQTSALVNARGNTLWQKIVGATLQQSAVAYTEDAQTVDHASRFELARRVLIDGDLESVAAKFYRIAMCYAIIAENGDSALDSQVTQVVTETFTAVANRVAGV